MVIFQNNCPYPITELSSGTRCKGLCIINAGWTTNIGGRVQGNIKQKGQGMWAGESTGQVTPNALRLKGIGGQDIFEDGGREILGGVLGSLNGC